MEAVAIGLMLIGIAVAFTGTIIILFAAFRQGPIWGISYLLIPFAALVFWIKYWEESKHGFKFKGVGLVMLFFGAMMAAAVAPEEPEPVDEVVKAPAPTQYWTPPKSLSAEEQRARLNLPASSVQTKPRPEEARAVVSRPETKKFEQVWADTATKTYYADGCRKTPPNAYRVAKSVVKAQGFTEARCP